MAMFHVAFWPCLPDLSFHRPQENPGKVRQNGRRVAQHLEVPHGKLAGRIVLAEINSTAPGDFQTLDAAIGQGFEFC